MDGIQKIAEKIINDSKEKANEILADAHSQQAQIQLNAQKKVEIRVLELKKKADSEAAALIGILTSTAELEMRNRILSGKQQLIEDVFERVGESLRMLSSEDYKSMMQAMLLEVIETGTEAVAFSENDRHTVAESLIEQTNDVLIRMGRTGRLSISEETMKGSRGFVVKATIYELDHSFESILKTARETLEPAIVKILFN